MVVSKTIPAVANKALSTSDIAAAVVLWLTLLAVIGAPVYAAGLWLSISRGAVFQAAIGAGAAFASVVTTIHLRS